MSNLNNLRKDIGNLTDILIKFDREIDLAPERLALAGKTIAHANKEQATWIVYYDSLRAEIQSVVKYLSMMVNKTRGQLTRRYTENYSRDLGDRLKDKYIDHDQEYLNVYELLLEAEEVLDKYKAIVDAFKARGFALRNIVEARVHQIEDNLL